MENEPSFNFIPRHFDIAGKLHIFAYTETAQPL